MNPREIIHWLGLGLLLAGTLCLFAAVGCVTTQPSIAPAPAPAVLRVIPPSGQRIKRVFGSNDGTNWTVLAGTNSFRYIKCQNHL